MAPERPDPVRSTFLAEAPAPHVEASTAPQASAVVERAAPDPAQIAEPEPPAFDVAPPALDGAPVLAPARPNGHAEPNRGLERGPANGAQPLGSAGCTAPQLRRFIKSRPYVPMHELRRRFGINGADDDVTPVQLPVGQVWVGLPRREGDLLGELLRNGEIGYELSLDPRSPIVVGLYPMRPVPRA